MTDVALPQRESPFRWRLAALNRLRMAALLLLLLAFCWSAVAVLSDSVECKQTAGAFSSGFNAGFDVSRCYCKTRWFELGDCDSVLMTTALAP
jgi:hypothetical protein